VQILVAQANLPPQASADPAAPMSSAIRSLIPPAGLVPYSAAIADYVRVCEAQGRGESALRLLGRLKVKRAQGRTSLGVIAVEFILLTIVLSIHSIFVLPQFDAIFRAAQVPMPWFTKMVFALIGPSGPFIYVGIVVLLVLFVWRTLPFLVEPILRPVDRVLLALPIVGEAIRQRNGDTLSGWLGFAAGDAPSQQAAIDAAQKWYLGNLLARECAEIQKEVRDGRDISACLATASGFDREFHATVAIADRADSLAALRARWRSVETLPEYGSALAPALVQIALGVVLAAVVIAMYLPIFSLATLM
jgi:type II secretory pathway component PulF